jgi:hypothetical protein
MERDFLGLSSKETLAVVKEEINNDGFKDPGIFFLYDFSFLFLALLLIFVYLLMICCEASPTIVIWNL